MGWHGRLRYWYAVWNFRMSVFPKYLVVSGLLGLLALITLSAVVYKAYINGADRLMESVQNTDLTAEKRTGAIMKLKLLAESDQRQTAELAADALTRAFRDENINSGLRQKGLEALTDV